MNNYHLYEEIGKGKYSTVYKGRKRHTIRYVAVKSIEKTRREKVMTEVSVVSQLHHPHVVAFVNWYETRNHLWIIFEYCPGGDLMRLLKQDGRLPEQQVKQFGCDISSGLLHVHAHGIIFCDLKPANVLSNEDGVLKLSDFGHSQRLIDIEHALLERAPLPRRGTPNYMAPELLQEGGLHSFASDLWALGCVVYEMFVGRPPFLSSTFQELQQIVLHDPAPLSCISSPEMHTLLVGLLRKNPLERVEWPALRTHNFWHGRTPGEDDDAQALPSQPHLEELRSVWSRILDIGSPSRNGTARPNASVPLSQHSAEAMARSRQTGQGVPVTEYGQPGSFEIGVEPSRQLDADAADSQRRDVFGVQGYPSSSALPFK